MANKNRGKNNNPEGRNQHSGFINSAKDRPMATAAATAAAVGAGVFLWSRRNQISDQISQLSDQFGEWTSTMRSGREGSEFEMAGGGSGPNSGTTSKSSSTKRSKPAMGLSETGGGNASSGAHSGGAGMNAASGGRGQA